MELRGLRRSAARVVHRVSVADDGRGVVHATLATRTVGEGPGPRWHVGVGDGASIELCATPDGELAELHVTVPTTPSSDAALEVVSRSAGTPVLVVDGWTPGTATWREPVGVDVVRVGSGELEARIGAAASRPLRSCWVGGNLQLLVDDAGRVTAVRIGPLLPSEWSLLER